MSRIYHHWESLECVEAGMYNTEPPEGYNQFSAKEAYRDFLADSDLFAKHMDGVKRDWPISCQHFLSNSMINRIAWMGQAAMCHYSSVPCFYRAGFCLLGEAQQSEANLVALKSIQAWMAKNETHLSLATPVQCEPVPEGMKARIRHYERYWMARGYPSGLPDEVPAGVAREKVAPSYRAIALAILRNDVNCISLGYQPPKYSVYDMFYKPAVAEKENELQMKLEI